MEGIVADLKSGRAVFLDSNVEAEIMQLTPARGEEWYTSSNTGRVTFMLRYAVPETEAKHARLILSRQAGA